MARIDILKNELKTMRDLKELTNMLEQVAAREIADMRETILQSRPFFQEAWRIHKIVSALSVLSPEVVHKHIVVVLAIDWGMPGDLLNRVIDRATIIHDQHGADVLVVGKMAHPRFRDKNDRTVYLFDLPSETNLNDIKPIYKIIAKYAQVSYVFPRFVSLAHQEVAVSSVSIGDRLRQVQDQEDEEAELENNINEHRFIFEPGLKQVSNLMNQVIVGLTVHHHFKEAALAYSAAQMIAMRNAFDNARDEVRHIGIRYNKARREVVDAKLRELYGSRVANKGGGL